MYKQRGVALSGLLFWGFILFMGAILGMKVLPTVMDYFQLLKDTKAVVNQVGKEATVADVRNAYNKFAQVDRLELTADQLDISKENGQIVISFAYQKQIPLFANVSLLIDYQGSTGGK